MTPHYRQSFFAALAGHLVLILAAVVVSVLPGCRRPKPVELFDVDLSIVNNTRPPSRLKPKPDHPVPPPPVPPVPTDVTDPSVPADPVPVRPAPVVAPPTPKPPDRGPDGTIRERTPPRDRPKPAASNLNAGATVPVPGIKIGPKVVAIRPGTGPRRPLPPLTPGALDPLGGMDAPRGDADSVNLEEKTRCLLLIKRALYSAWERPTLADAGPQTAIVQLRFDLSGRVASASISRSSGSDVMDRSVLLAARTAPRVDGLTPGFLKEYPVLPVEFEVEK